MKYGEISVELTGESDLLMNNIESMDQEQSTKIKTKKYDDKEEAEKRAYWTKGKKSLMVPERAIYSMMISAAKFFKIKGKSLATTMGGTVRIEPAEISLGTNKYEIDKRAVNIQGNRIMRCRPRVSNWTLSFTIKYNSDYMDPATLKKVLEEGGVKVGLLDFRPATKGQFGVFTVSKFKVVS